MPDSIKPNYENLGLDQFGNALNGPGATRIYKTALDFNIQQEPTPYLHRTAISNRGGTIRTNLGGVVDFRDVTGGTSLLTYNPTTGLITILGTVTLTTAPITFTSVTNGSSFITMANAGGTVRMKMEINSNGFGFLTADSLVFSSNTANQLNESFGPQFQLADTAGVHALRVVDSGTTEIWRFASDGLGVQSRAKSFVLKGTIADPGSQGALTGAIFVGTSGTAGKSTLRVEFPTGASQQLAGEP